MVATLLDVLLQQKHIDVGNYTCRLELGDYETAYICMPRSGNTNRQLKITVALAEVKSNHWLDVIVDVERLETEEAREAIAVATKIAHEIEQHIHKILFRYSENLNKIFSAISQQLSINFNFILPFIGIGISPDNTREDRTTRTAQKRRPNTLEVSLGLFVHLVIKAGRDYWGLV